MADNTLQSGADTIATDDVTTLNGGASSGVKVQRVKVTFGDDNTARDASPAFPLPTNLPDVTATGNITVATGTVTLPLSGQSGAAVQLTGTWTGTVQFEGTVDGSTWVPINAVAAATSGPGATTTVNGLYRLTPGGLTSLRVTATALTVGMIVVTMRAASGTGGIFANQNMPVTGSGVAGTPAAGVITVQGNAAGTPQPVSGTFFQATQPVSMATNTPDVTDRAARVLGVLPDARASTLAVTVTAASGAAATLTLPAPGAGLFHCITALDVVLYSAAARTGSATPTLVTTTNLPGSPVFTFSTAGAIGTTDVQKLAPCTPLKSSAANTATTIVAPIATGGIWRITATYFTGA